MPEKKKCFEDEQVVKNGLELVCRRCKYKWLYGGESDWYTSCPRCKGTVSVRNEKKKFGVKVD